MSPNQQPEKPIRRFDFFAEYSRLDRLAKGYPEDESKGYGIWLAKIVASRKSRTKEEGPLRSHDKSEPEPKFRSLSDGVQTDETFDHDIVERMGPEFYREVFAPAIQAARNDGQKYEEIRDAIRKDWKPAS